jgi:hypothetical protein
MFRYKSAVVHFSYFTAEGYTSTRFQRYRKEEEEVGGGRGGEEKGGEEE